MVLEESANIRGWLMKKLDHRLTWKKRFFVLQNNQLVYYRSLRDNKPRNIYIIDENSKVVDYGVNDNYHQFSLYLNGKRALWLAAEDNKARYWISVMRTEIDRQRSSNGKLFSEETETNDFVLPPLTCGCNDNSCLRDNIESSIIPSSMQELSYLLHTSSLKTTLEATINGCLAFSIDWKSAASSPYYLMTMSIPLDMEYVSYFLVDMECARNIWDPLFFRSEVIEQIDQNNSILHLIYKPIHVLEYPCIIHSHLRDFCVHRHFSYDEATNTYYILLSSVTHPQCPPSSSYVRDVGYRIEAVNSGVSRISTIYSIYPGGHMSSFQYCIDSFQRSFMMSLPGLRDMLSQIPEYHILNLIERIVKGIHCNPSVTPSVSIDEDSISKEKMDEDEDETPMVSDSEDSLSTQVLLPPYLTNTIPHASECDLMTHCWEEVDGTIWNVRSKDYALSHTKIRSESNYCKLLCVDIFKSSSRISHVAKREESAIHIMKQMDLTKTQAILIINLQITGNVSIVSYLAVPQTESNQVTPVSSLLHRFFTESDNWRNNHLKLLPHIVEGNILVRKMVGMTPCIIGNKGESHYFTGETPVPYLECDYDMDGSTVARNLSKYLFAAENMVIELAFVLQGESTEELPERVLGGFRFYHIDTSKAKVI